MKAPLPLYLIIALAFSLLRCTDESIKTSDETRITFSAYGLQEIDSHRLLVTLSNSANEKILELTAVDFSISGSEFITENLSLPPGNYSINDFVIVDEGDNILFAAPRTNGTTTHFTRGHSIDPLPQLELINTAGRRPNDLGYKTFQLRQNGLASVTVKTSVSGSNDMIEAEALIMQGADTIHRTVLNKRVNKIAFPAQAGEEYRLLVAEDGYSLFTQLLSPEMIKGNKPVNAELSPAFTMVAKTNPEGNFGVEIDGFPGEIVVDWGDGTYETIVLANPDDVDVLWEHHYATPGKYFISITGDLTQIHTLLFAQGINSAIDRINVDQLTELQDFRFIYTDAPDTVDASSLNKLVWFIFWNTDVKHIKISEENPPFNIELEESRYVTQESFAGLIDDIYDAEVAGKNVQFVSWAYHPDPEQGLIILPIGSPTEETLEKMLILQNVYGVDFGPDVEYNFGSGEPF